MIMFSYFFVVIFHLEFDFICCILIFLSDTLFCGLFNREFIRPY